MTNLDDIRKGRKNYRKKEREQREKQRNRDSTEIKAKELFGKKQNKEKSDSREINNQIKNKFDTKQNNPQEKLDQLQRNGNPQEQLKPNENHKIGEICLHR